MILLDTNVLIDRSRYLFDEGETYAASALSRAELEFGIGRASDVVERQSRQGRLAELDAVFDWLAFDVAASRSYGRLTSAAPVTGARIRSVDALLAAQAHSIGASVMTANLTDFAPFAAHVLAVPPTLRDRSADNDPR